MKATVYGLSEPEVGILKSYVHKMFFSNIIDNGNHPRLKPWRNDNSAISKGK